MVEEREPVLPFGSFLFPRIFQTFRMSIQPTKLILAFLVLTAVCLTGHLMDYSQTVVVKPDDGRTELDEYVAWGLSMTIEHIRLFDGTSPRIGVFETLWRFGSRQFNQALSALPEYRFREVVQSIGNCLVAPLWAMTFHPIYSLIFFTITLAAISLAGGALCRIAALQFARGEKPGLIEALRFGAAKFSSFVTAPLIPIGIMAALGVFIVVLGLLGNARYVGELSLGLLLPLALMLAVPITIFLIGAIAGFNLMFPAIAYEDSDGFDAVSRSFSYVYAQPWHMGFYTVIAFIYGAVCYAFVRVFSLLLLHITRTFVELGFLNHSAKLERIWPQPPFHRFIGSVAATPAGWAESISAFLIHAWVLAVMGLMVSFVISFYFTANTIVYALMRKRVDKTSLAEVHTRADEMAVDTTVTEPATTEITTSPNIGADPGKIPETSE